MATRLDALIKKAKELNVTIHVMPAPVYVATTPTGMRVYFEKLEDLALSLERLRRQTKAREVAKWRRELQEARKPQKAADGAATAKTPVPHMVIRLPG